MDAQSTLLRRLEEAGKRHQVEGVTKTMADRVADCAAYTDFFDRGDLWGGTTNRTTYPARHYAALEHKMNAPQSASVLAYFCDAHTAYIQYYAEIK